jgi:hypothetical protein
MKRRIRLTEGDLHRIVKESVSQVLTELDWKTYINAARKRQMQGKTDKSSNLADYAQQQFNRQHFNGYGAYGVTDYGGNGTASALLRTGVGLENGTMHDHREITAPFYDSYIHQTPWGNYREPIGTSTKASADMWNVFGRTNGQTGHFSHNRIYSDPEQAQRMSDLVSKKQQWTDKNSADYGDKALSVANDLYGYYNGGTKYVPGKGWQVPSTFDNYHGYTKQE